VLAVMSRPLRLLKFDPLKMHSKVFTSTNGWFKLTLPSHWDEYNLEDEDGTYGFFNSRSNHWTGNLRVTPLKLSPVDDDSNHKISEHIKDELAQHDGAIRVKIGDFDCAFYKKDRQVDGEQLLLYYWIMGKREFLFICSFTINKEREFTKENESELATAQEIIESIKTI